MSEKYNVKDFSTKQAKNNWTGWEEMIGMETNEWKTGNGVANNYYNYYHHKRCK